MDSYNEKYYQRKINASYVTSVISITLVLFTLGFLGLFVLHAKSLSNYVKENIGFEIIMKDGVKFTQGKNVVVWAVIGLAIIFLSYTLVGFVITALTGGSSPSENGTPTGPIGCCDTGVACFDNETKSDCDYKSGTFYTGGEKCMAGSPSAPAAKCI